MAINIAGNPSPATDFLGEAITSPIVHAIDRKMNRAVGYTNMAVVEQTRIAIASLNQAPRSQHVLLGEALASNRLNYNYELIQNFSTVSARYDQDMMYNYFMRPLNPSTVAMAQSLMDNNIKATYLASILSTLGQFLNGLITAKSATPTNSIMADNVNLKQQFLCSPELGLRNATFANIITFIHNILGADQEGARIVLPANIYNNTWSLADQTNIYAVANWGDVTIKTGVIQAVQGVTFHCLESIQVNSGTNLSEFYNPPKINVTSAITIGATVIPVGTYNVGYIMLPCRGRSPLTIFTTPMKQAQSTGITITDTYQWQTAFATWIPSVQQYIYPILFGEGLPNTVAGSDIPMITLDPTKVSVDYKPLNRAIQQVAPDLISPYV